MAEIKGFDNQINYKKLFKAYGKKLSKEIKQLEKTQGKDYKWKEYIGDIPDLFDLLINILCAEITPTVYRVRIIMALSYLLAPVDVIPEEVYGLEGYIDDFAVMILLLDSIKKHLPKKVIVENWKKKTDILEYIDSSMDKVKLFLNKNIRVEFKRIFDPEKI